MLRLCSRTLKELCRQDDEKMRGVETRTSLTVKCAQKYTAFEIRLMTLQSGVVMLLGACHKLDSGMRESVEDIANGRKC